jgi:hypothetical protein
MFPFKQRLNGTVFGRGQLSVLIRCGEQHWSRSWKQHHAKVTCIVIKYRDTNSLRFTCMAQLLTYVEAHYSYLFLVNKQPIITRGRSHNCYLACHINMPPLNYEGRGYRQYERLDIKVLVEGQMTDT